jgi:hypothetical protein
MGWEVGGLFEDIVWYVVWFTDFQKFEKGERKEKQEEQCAISGSFCEFVFLAPFIDLQ